MSPINSTWSFYQLSNFYIGAMDVYFLKGSICRGTLAILHSKGAYSQNSSAYIFGPLKTTMSEQLQTLCRRIGATAAAMLIEMKEREKGVVVWKEREDI